jgi:hypothetical protein
MQTFRLDSEQANLIRKLAKNTDEPEKLSELVEAYCPATVQYVHRMHSSPWDSHMWRVTVALHAMNEIMAMYGVEGLGPTSGPSYAPPYEYLNAGDTYNTTLIYRRSTDTLSIGTWGDIAEKHPSWE